MDVVEITSSTGTLNASDLAKLGPNCLIKYTHSTLTEYLAMSRKTSTSFLYSSLNLNSKGSPTDELSFYEAVIDKSTGGYNTINDTSYYLKTASIGVSEGTIETVVGITSNNYTRKESATHFRIPAGGTAGQVLSKVDGTDYNIGWATPSGGGSSGHTLTLTMQSGHSVVVYYADGTSETVTANATKSNVVGFKITNSDNMNDITAGIVFGYNGATTSFFINGWTVDEDIAYLLLSDTTLGLHGMG